MTEILRTSEFGSSSGHWYTQDRTLVEQVSGSNGKPIKPDLRHARKLDLAPGVTSVMGMAHKPALVKWQCEQVAHATVRFLLKTNIALSSELGLPKEFVDQILLDSQEQVRKAAERGTDIHAAIESSLKDGTDHHDPEVRETVMAAHRVLHNAFGPVQWRSETVAVSRYGYGTKVDLWFQHGDSIVVLDIKSKDGPTADCKLWDEHPEQLAAGGLALRHSGYTIDSPEPLGPNRAAVLFVSRTLPGDCTLASCPDESLPKGLRRFLALLRFWQLKRDYKPSWAEDFTV
jgi:hypothetical protein